jgi:hypothetical protein
VLRWTEKIRLALGLGVECALPQHVDEVMKKVRGNGLTREELVSLSATCPNLMNVCVLAPLFEECFKEMFGFKGNLAVIVYEFVRDVTSGLTWQQAVYVRTLSTIMHLITQLFAGNLAMRLGVHSGWNTFVCLLHRLTWHRGVVPVPAELAGCGFTDLSGLAQGVPATAGAVSIGAALLGRWVGQWVRSIWERPQSPLPSPAEEVGAWRAHVQHYHLSSWEERVVPLSEAVRTTRFPIVDGVVARQTVPHFDWPEACPYTGVKYVGTTEDALDSFDYQPARQYMYFILPTCVPLYAPDRSDANLWGVVKARLLAKPPMDPKVQMLAWLDVDVLLTAEESPIEVNEHHEEWLAHFDDTNKKRKMISALKQLSEGVVSRDHAAYRRTEVMVKTDEVLVKVADRDCYRGSHVMLKPRPIAIVDPLVQADVGPAIYEATQRLKQRWPPVPYRFYGLPAPSGTFDEQPYRCGHYRVYVTYGCALNDRELSNWMDFACSPPAHPYTACIIAAGDDSLVARWHNGVLSFLEADATAADQSESVGPLNCEYRVLRKLGVKLQDIEKLRHVARADYVIRGREGWTVKVDRTHRPTRDTGGPDTSIGNTIVFVHAWTHVIAGDWDLTIFDALGLKMKIQETSERTAVTFLKGMWYPVVYQSGLRDYRWAPLPSRFLKVGKALRDPLTLYKRKKNRLEASALYLNDVAASYASFLQVPILRAFVETFQVGPVIRDLTSEEPWRPRPSPDEPVQIDVQAALEAVGARYGLSEADILGMEDQIRQAAVGSYLEHPGYWALAAKDYA